MMEQTDIETDVEGVKSKWRSWCWEGGGKAGMTDFLVKNYNVEQRRIVFGEHHFVGAYPAFVARVGFVFGAQSALQLTAESESGAVASPGS